MKLTQQENEESRLARRFSYTKQHKNGLIITSNDKPKKQPNTFSDRIGAQGLSTRRSSQYIWIWARVFR